MPVDYALPGGPVLLGGPVVTGFGRGSRQLGVPTANIDPVPLQDMLSGLPLGVYFGCAGALRIARTGAECFASGTLQRLAY